MPSSVLLLTADPAQVFMQIPQSAQSVPSAQCEFAEFRPLPSSQTPSKADVQVFLQKFA
jgi:hypothetical protein